MTSNDLIKRLIDAGLSFTQMTQAKAEEIAKDLQEAGQLRVDEAQSTVQELMARGREKGFVTYDEVNDALPSDVGSDQIDDVMSMFGEHDIEVVDGAEKKMKLPDKPPEPEEKEEAKAEEKEEEDDAGYAWWSSARRAGALH